MPLNKSLRDEEKERINAILKKLVELMHVPDFGKDKIDEELKSLGLTTEVLLNSIHSESRTFSFEIFGKIGVVKGKL
jgi:hypothetical protein